MELFKLPTDNFYIFLLFGGLALIIYFLNLFFKKFTELTNVINLLDQDITMQEIKLNDEKKKQDFTINEIGLRNFAFVIKYEIDYFTLAKEGNEEKIAEYIAKQENTDVFIEDFLRIKALLNSKDSSTFGLDITNKGLISKQSKVDAKIVELNSIKKISSFAIGFGVLLIIIGLCFWYSKNQSYQDKILKLNFEKALKEDSTRKEPVLLK